MSKYNTYKIIVKENNKERNVFESGDYKESIKQYKKVKESNRDKSCEVLFMASNNETSSILWNKVFCNKDDTNNIKNGDNITDVISNKKDILLEIRGVQNLVKSMKLEHDKNLKLLDCMNKKRDVCYHEVEYNFNKEISDKDKLDMFNKLGDVANKRREIKNKINLYENIKNNLSQLESNANKIIEVLSDTYNKDNKINFSKNHMAKFNFYKEKKYNSEKDRVKILSRFQKMFKNVSVDEVHKIIIGYNNGYDSKDNLVRQMK